MKYLFLLFLISCVTEQTYRQDAELRKIQETKEEEEQIKREERIIKDAAHDAVAQAIIGVRKAHEDALTVHKTVIEKAVSGIVDKKLEAVGKELAGTKITVDKFVVKTNTEKTVLKAYVDKFIERADKKLGIFDDRIGANREAMLANTRDFTKLDTGNDLARNAAIERLDNTEKKTNQGELNIIDIRRLVNSLEDETDDLKKLITKTGGGIESAEDKASLAMFVGIATPIILGILTLLGVWLKTRKNK